jgi:hypothetical protein
MFIYSTAPQDWNIPIEVKNADSSTRAKEVVFIRGGAQVAQFKTGEIWTPLGLKTELTDDQYNAIKNHCTFKALVELGHFKAIGESLDVEVVAVEDMKAPTYEEGAPVTESEMNAELEKMSDETGIDFAMHSGKKLKK